ncbi:hypothetical protein EJ06DRAFT_559647 [Trichodelitschia bisporula]|uniref:Uncharacterized protein n=1 Tax=Trichodelitschia bisporula TaxID=703511 RepID=A0A6G1HKZ5_9PEZI|nr:hypothetical protein EJ06DRAFT_559647 [Trichodelitschia bisporula]
MSSTSDTREGQLIPEIQPHPPADSPLTKPITFGLYKAHRRNASPQTNASNPFTDPEPPNPVYLHRPPPLRFYGPAASSLSVATIDSDVLSPPQSPWAVSRAPSQEMLRPERFPSDLPERPKSEKKPFFTRAKERVYKHVEPAAVLHLIDFRPWFWPFTIKKYSVLFLIACAIAGIIVSNMYFHWIDKSMKITRTYMLPVLIISVCAEPLIMIIILLVAKMPDIPKEEVDMIMNQNKQDEDIEARASEKKREPQGPFETALVIPCHDTDETAMRTTLESAFPHFRPQDIFLVDNGRTRHPRHPTCNFRAFIRSIHPDIVYIWSPIGSKNAAQLVGTLAARDYKYIMTVDDDVCIPMNFRAPTEMIDERFKAVAYPLKAMDADCNVPLWMVAWQDVEYRLAGISKMAEDRLCGVQFPHGAGWFVERDTFLTLMEYYHPMDFIAEDCNAGLGINRMGKGIRCDGRSYLATEVPTTLFGPGLNWWKQRQKSWEMGRHGQLFAYIRQFLWSMPPRRTVQGILWHKLTYFYLICCIAIDWLRIPTIIALGRTATWWRNAVLLMLFSAIPPLYYSYVSCRRRPDMKPRFWACFTYPWYKQLYTVVSIFGAIRAVGYFFGGHPRPPTIQQMLKNKDDRCFWLDPRFATNPAYLADEGEAIEAAKAGESTEALNEKSQAAPPPDLVNPFLDPPRAAYHARRPSASEIEIDVTPEVSTPERPEFHFMSSPFADSSVTLAGPGTVTPGSRSRPSSGRGPGALGREWTGGSELTLVEAAGPERCRTPVVKAPVGPFVLRTVDEGVPALPKGGYFAYTPPGAVEAPLRVVN